MSRLAVEQHGIVDEARNRELTRRFVSCGRPPSTIRIVIVDPVTLEPRPSGHVGEICLAGENIAAGYWGKPVETAASFRAFVPNTSDGPFLRTGDLGFLQDGELFIAGRLKDLIIIRGRNIHPQDIELTVEKCHPALRRGCTIAFSLKGEVDECSVVVQEVRDATDDERVAAIGAIRRAVMTEHDLVPYAVVLVSAGGVPKTSSGKLQRAACRVAYRAGELPIAKEHVIGRFASETVEAAPS